MACHFDACYLTTRVYSYYALELQAIGYYCNSPRFVNYFLTN